MADVPRVTGLPHVAAGTVHWGVREAPVRSVTGFAERYGTWTGRAWLEVLGPRWRVPIDRGYSEVRCTLRAELPDRPWVSDWSEGRFPAAPWGLPSDPLTVLAVTVVAISAIGVAAVAGPWGAGAVVLGASWPLVRLRDGVRVHRLGVRVGPVWAGRVGWHDIERVHLVSGRGRGVVVVVHSRFGMAGATVPAILVPALRARMRRLGGLDLLQGPGDRLDTRYARLRALAVGAPWGVGLTTCAGVWFTPRPWDALAVGLGVTAAVALLGAAIQARATGWGAGAVLWLTVLYGALLGFASAAASGWVQLLP